MKPEGSKAGSQLCAQNLAPVGGGRVEGVRYQSGSGHGGAAVPTGGISRLVGGEQMLRDPPQFFWLPALRSVGEDDFVAWAAFP